MKKPPAPVTAAAVIQKTVPVQISAIGNVEAYSTVSVKSQIGGELIRVHFREGQDVKKGDLLFTIDLVPMKQRSSRLKRISQKILLNSKMRVKRSGVMPNW